MQFKVEETRFKDGYFVLDSMGDPVDEFESKHEAEVLCEILNDTYNRGFQDGKDHVLNGGEY